MILGPALRPQYKKYLPTWLFDRLDIISHGWENHRKAEYHDKLGKTFVLVTPDECALWVADHELGNVILQRRKYFEQPPITTKIVGLLGPSVLTTNGEDWQRQRRIVAPNLNESISETVWDESCLQAKAMLQYMVQNPGDQTLNGLRVIAKNVIGKAGYDANMPWTTTEHHTPGSLGGETGAYFQTISLVADNILPAALLPSWFMRLPIMPCSLQTLGAQMDKVPQYIKSMLKGERESASKKPRDNFLSMLVRLSDQEAKSFGSFLTEEEISGNLFTFTAAGFDSTANTMGYAVTLLAAYPEWQGWIREELSGLDADLTKWTYESIYSKCPRILSVMHETLRHFPPVLHSTRCVAQTQEVADENGTHVLPASMEVFVSHQCIHRDPSIWGDDCREFRPSRWIDSAGQIITPAKGTFLPWSAGPRICPGVKIAQVEFVATFATLFRSARCEPLPSDSQDPETLRQNLRDVVADSIVKLTVQVRDPRKVKLRWIPE
ncbi:hypothetical protein N7541_004443 [Penicillium brevicompactum]|uniref:Cytochrome P450 n=1 Tax=Penicillium brevicompactum TaxID=5074 RepID=A0A9W9RD21_PENBR|nr:hypothetical protein N7541_004443 [Penicillium brevicompactum]